MPMDEFRLDRSMVRGLLGVEEWSHPWASGCSTHFSFPLLRTWDGYSGSQPDELNRMDSRAQHKSLGTFEARRTSLATHINHGKWEPTPYISFTSSPQALQELANQTLCKRGPQTITAIDPINRLQRGLPILDLAAEMEHYNVPNPYRGGDEYCRDHYICLWQVTEDEIIGHWKWEELSKSGNWYEEIIMPAFRRFGPAPLEETSDLSAIMSRLCGKFKPENFGTFAELMKKVNDEPPDKVNRFREAFGRRTDNDVRFLQDLDDDSEGHCYDSERDWDTDDEVEEQNASDDLLKMIEGTFRD